ncbi:MAG: hypothetical protein MUE53_08305 [Chitinophagales bacterium]|nr:hypothetical protein [Chitinophagales bacterium]
MAIILGNEHNGISAETRKLVDGFVQIPSYGFTESFNVSVAAAIIGYTLNQRIRNQHHAVLLTEEEKENLYYQWIWHSVKRPDILYHEFQKSYIK